MNSIVCTLFEGSYHYGVAGLVNSLYAHNFSGEVFIGYKGELPNWTKSSESNDEIKWKGCKTLYIGKGLILHFVPVATTRHLTNYKSIFMLQLMEFTKKGVFYFDPDIVVKCDWAFFEQWIEYGVAIVQEIVSNHVSPNHPKRLRWKQVIESCGRNVERNLYNYYNGGFCGVSKKNIEFLEAWEDVMLVGINEYGMDDNYFVKQINQLSMFPVGDQDALNIAAMCSKSEISDFGPEGMDFIHGGWLMSHAAGKPKPWAASYIKKGLKGQSISQPEKLFWNYADGIIKSFPSRIIKQKKLAIKIGSFFNRFYLRS